MNKKFIFLVLFFLSNLYAQNVLKIGVLRRAKRLLLSIAPIAVLFLIWDAYAIAQGHWYFDESQIIGIYGPLKIPFEEFLFFIFVPIAAIMTLEAVRSVKKHWKVGDE